MRPYNILALIPALLVMFSSVAYADVEVIGVEKKTIGSDVYMMVSLTNTGPDNADDIKIMLDGEVVYGLTLKAGDSVTQSIQVVDPSKPNVVTVTSGKVGLVSESASDVPVQSDEVKSDIIIHTDSSQYMYYVIAAVVAGIAVLAYLFLPTGKRAA